MNYLGKEWREQTRGKGLWFAVGLVALLTLLLLFQAREFPREQGFEAYLLSLYDLNVYLVPLLSLFLASFAVLQEKEQKTLLILLTKKESQRTFFRKKGVAVQAVIWGVFMGAYLLLALPMKLILGFDGMSFLAFLAATSALLLVFNQIGLLLGSLCANRTQLLGANIFVWFLMVFLLDLVYLYALPSVTYGNVEVFAWLYFADPLHAIRFYLEAALAFFPMHNLSTLLKKMVLAPPPAVLLVNVAVWVAFLFELAVLARRKGDLA